MIRGSVGLILLAGLALVGCGVNDRAKPAWQIDEVPAVPDGFEALKVDETGYRSARVHSPTGPWVVTWQDGRIKISPYPYHVIHLDQKWHPREGATISLHCQAFRKGNETVVQLVGTNDFLHEETHVYFDGTEAVRVTKYSLPGDGRGPEAPGEWVPYEQRVKSERLR